MYLRLFSSILDSSINISSVPPAHRWLWITMLIVADEDATGVVDMPMERLAARAGLPVADVMSGLEFLAAPDSDSRSRVQEGRRIVPLEEGSRAWKIVNWEEYQEIQKAENKRAKTREKVARWRAKNAKPVPERKEL